MEGKTLELPKTWQGRTRGVWKVTGLGLQRRRESEIWQATSEEGRIPKQGYRAVESQGRQPRGLGQEEWWHWIGSSWGVRKPEDRQKLENLDAAAAAVQARGLPAHRALERYHDIDVQGNVEISVIAKGKRFFIWDLDLSPGDPAPSPMVHTHTHTPWLTLIPSCLNPAQALERPYLFSSTTSGSQTDSAVMRRESMPSCSAGSQLNL